MYVVKRNHLLFIKDISLVLWPCELLKLKNYIYIEDCNSKNENKKTNAINNIVKKAIDRYLSKIKLYTPSQYLFKSKKQ